MKNKRTIKNKRVTKTRKAYEHPTITGGEKAFTPKVRAKLIAEADRLAWYFDTKAARMYDMAQALSVATTLEDLEAIHRDLWVYPPLGAPELTPIHEYYMDNRSTCHHCKRKSHGGYQGFYHSDRERFYCWREECCNRLDRDVAKDKRLHPKLYKKPKKDKMVREGRVKRLR